MNKMHSPIESAGRHELPAELKDQLIEFVNKVYAPDLTQPLREKYLVCIETVDLPGLEAPRKNIENYFDYHRKYPEEREQLESLSKNFSAWLSAIAPSE